MELAGILSKLLGQNTVAPANTGTAVVPNGDAILNGQAPAQDASAPVNGQNPQFGQAQTTGEKAKALLKQMQPIQLPGTQVIPQTPGNNMPLQWSQYS